MSFHNVRGKAVTFYFKRWEGSVSLFFEYVALVTAIHQAALFAGDVLAARSENTPMKHAVLASVAGVRHLI